MHYYTAQITSPLAAAQANRRSFVSLWASTDLCVHGAAAAPAVGPMPSRSESGGDHLLAWLLHQETLLPRLQLPKELLPANSGEPHWLVDF